MNRETSAGCWDLVTISKCCGSPMWPVIGTVQFRDSMPRNKSALLHRLFWVDIQVLGPLPGSED